jgi:CHAT domain-containing protein
LLIPPDLKEVLKRAEPLVVEVDRTLAAMQWETLPAGLDRKPLGVARQVARQLRTFYSPRPFEPGSRQTLKALVIGDPSGRGLSIEEARKEAIEVEKILRNFKVETQLRIGAPEDGTGAGEGGTAPADYFEIVDLLLSGEFDIVHYSGHATFDPVNPDRVGWVFKAGMLTAHEIEGMDRPPRLVVANACLSAQLSQQTGARADTTAKTPAGGKRGDASLVANLADEFFKQGVSDYIGAAWEIPSGPAKLFAAEFYRHLLAPEGKIGRALLQARTALYEKRADFGAAWAAYQHYGDPTRSLPRTALPVQED